MSALPIYRSPRTKTPDLLNALRNWHPTHGEVIELLQGVASAIKHSHNALSDSCRNVVVDYCDEATGQIDQDEIDQRSDKFAQPDDSWMRRQDEHDQQTRTAA